MKLLAFVFLMMLSGCYSNYHTVGNGPNRHSYKTKYSNGKDVYFLWGLAKLGDSEPKHPEKDYLIKTGFTFGDHIISFFTLGIVSTRTTKIFVSTEKINEQEEFQNDETIPKAITLKEYSLLPETEQLEAGDFVYFLKNNEVRKGRLLKKQSYRSRVREYDGIYKKIYTIDVENSVLRKANLKSVKLP